MNEDLPKHFIEIYLRPGDFYWGGEATRIQTLLGSCVTLTFWHPKLKQGGMCHFMLPTRSSRREGEGVKSRGKYGTEAMRMFFEEIRRLRTEAADYEIKMFGGGNMFSTAQEFSREALIGENNVNFARRFLAEHKLKLVSEDVGGSFHRKIFFDVWSGHVWLKRTASVPARVRPNRSA